MADLTLRDRRKWLLLLAYTLSASGGELMLPLAKITLPDDKGVGILSKRIFNLLPESCVALVDFNVTASVLAIAGDVGVAVAPVDLQ